MCVAAVEHPPGSARRDNERLNRRLKVGTAVTRLLSPVAFEAGAVNAHRAMSAASDGCQRISSRCGGRIRTRAADSFARI